MSKHTAEQIQSEILWRIDAGDMDAVEMLRAYASMLAAQEKAEHAATVADVYQSRYTLEWNGHSYPEGTKLYAHPPAPKGE